MDYRTPSEQIEDPTVELGPQPSFLSPLHRSDGVPANSFSFRSFFEFLRVDCRSVFRICEVYKTWWLVSDCWLWFVVRSARVEISNRALLGRMASSCIRQMATLSLKSRVLAAPKGLKVVGLSSPSFTPAVTPSLKQACEPLRSGFQAVTKTSLTGGRDKSTVFAQAVTTTPETEAEADTTEETTVPETTEDAPAPTLKTKKLRKRVKHIMEILNKDALEAANAEKVIPDIRPGDVIQLRVEVPENKRRVSLLRGIVISRRNAGINTTFRIRRVIAGVGVEMVFPLYSPNIKEIKVVDKRKVRRAKLFYLRDKIARMSSC